MSEAFTWFFVFFQQEFRRGNLQAFQTLMGLSLAHFFGCYNPKQLADFLGIPHQRLYEHLKTFSLYSLKAMLLKFMVHQACLLQAGSREAQAHPEPKCHHPVAGRDHADGG